MSTFAEMIFGRESLTYLIMTDFDGWSWIRFGGRRLLPNWPTVPILAEEMTVERCIDGCSSSHYTSAGLEYGQ